MIKTTGSITTGFAPDIEKLLETQEIFDWLQDHPNNAQAFFWNYTSKTERRRAILCAIKEMRNEP